MKIIEEYNGKKLPHPIYSWADEIEEEAFNQAVNIVRMPNLYKHLAIMPDVHSGYGMPIGGVAAFVNVIIPYAVGVDIGCGMIARRLNIKKEDLPKEILGMFINRVKKKIPLGFEHHKKPRHWDKIDEFDDIYILRIQKKEALHQLGTLGGGNHFIEVDYDQEGYVWIMIHSGSRHVGKETADYYHRLAVEFVEKYYKKTLSDKNLSFFYLDSKEGQEYFKAMNLCLDFAYENRYQLMEDVLDILHTFVYFEIIDEVHIHHNFASVERHFDREVIVHRKGAVLADKGVRGIIPGSMGTKSYITKGKGNPLSFKSSSHGAGRVMSRHKAMKTLTIQEVEEAMKGVVHLPFKSKRQLDEAPQAYKDIDEVIKQEEDLINIEYILKPMAVVKG